MISGNKIRANRDNAKNSSGAKTANGRARSARNALRHGLSLPVHSNPALSEVVETLAREIAGPTANAEILELARAIAESQIDFRRVRNARQQRLASAYAQPFYETRAATWKKVALLKPFLTRRLADVAVPDPVVRLVTLTPQGLMKLATILSREAKWFRAMDRYERRALSRRKFAVRAFDEARRRAGVIV
jgi:hypothetical protein